MLAIKITDVPGLISNSISEIKNINIFLKFSEKSIIYSWFNTKRIINTMRHIFKNPFKNLFKQK